MVEINGLIPTIHWGINKKAGCLPGQPASILGEEILVMVWLPDLHPLAAPCHPE